MKPSHDVTAGNNLLKGTEWEGKSLEEIVKGSFGKNAGLFNNAGQHYNHTHFWKWMKPGGGGDKIPGDLQKKITSDLGGVAKAHPDFPVLVVVHSAGKLPDARVTARTEHAAVALRDRGAPKVETTIVGTALPRVDPREPGAAARNDRVEIVFVAPSAS